QDGIILLLLVLFGTLLRTYLIHLPGIDTNESFSWRLAVSPITNLIQKTATDVHPPAYYLLLKAWISLWGDSVFALRSLSIVFGALSIPFAYLTVRHALAVLSNASSGFSPNARYAALLAAVLMTVNPAQVQHSRVARMYSFGALLAGITSLCLL